MLRIAIASKANENAIAYQEALTTLGAAHTCTLSLDELAQFDGLLIPGGGDIDPSFLNDIDRGSKNIDVALDMAQFALISEFANAGKPILGICRGHQVLNVYFGGGLIQDLGEAGNATHQWTEEAGYKVHQTTATTGSFIAKLYGETFATNSAHHQGLGTLGHGIVSVQTSADGTNEAIAHESLPIYGVQWHPERMCFAHARPDTVDGSKVLQFFLDECSRVKEEMAAE